MIKLDIDYTDYRDDTDPNYPGGKAVDSEEEDSYDGTPYKADWMNDINGFRQALYKDAFGGLESISKLPDHANESDSMKALYELFALRKTKLKDEIESDALPITEDNPLVTILQVIRNNLKHLFSNKANLDGGAAFSGGEVTIPTKTGLTQNELCSAKNAVNYEMLTSLLFPVGRSYVQYPGDQSPNEMGWPGVWSDYTNKPVIYGLAATNPSSYKEYSSGTFSCAANDYVVYTHASTDKTIVRARSAMTNPGEFNPINWIFPGETGFGVTVTRYERNKIIAWNATDLDIKAQISGGTYNGQYIWDRVVMAGKFPSFAGGNRPTFVSGGVSGDTSRILKGDFAATRLMMGASGYTYKATGVFDIWLNPTASYQPAESQLSNTLGFNFSSDRVVPTKPEGGSRTFSTRYWRRVS